MRSHVGSGGEEQQACKAVTEEMEEVERPTRMQDRRRHLLPVSQIGPPDFIVDRDAEKLEYTSVDLIVGRYNPGACYVMVRHITHPPTIRGHT